MVGQAGNAGDGQAGNDGEADGQAGNGNAGGAEDLFPHPWSVRRTRRCGPCLEEIQGVGYGEAYRKLSMRSKQCQKCQTILCDNHIKVICRRCASTLMVRPPPEDPMID